MAKLFYLINRLDESLTLAEQLETETLQTQFKFWPGPIWRRFGGLAALTLDTRNALPD